MAIDRYEPFTARGRSSIEPTSHVNKTDCTRSSASSEWVQESTAERAAPPWFINCPIDLLFCCGGLLWIVVAFTSYHLHSASWALNLQYKAASLLTLAGTYFITFPHHAATWVRIYCHRDAIKKYRGCAILLPIAILPLFMIAAIRPDVIPWYVRISAIWNVQHWVAQSYGISCVYMMRAKIELSSKDKSVLRVMCYLLWALVAVRILAFPQMQQLDYVGITIAPVCLIPPEAARILEQFLLNSIGAVVLYLLLRCCTLKRMPPLAVLALWATTLRITTFPFSSFAFIWSYGLPFFHSLQYLVISSSFYLKEREAMPATISSTRRQPFIATCWQTFKLPNVRAYYVFLIIISAMIYTLLPILVAQCGMPMTNATALVLLLLNLHHILTDGIIWRLRDPDVRSSV